MRKLMPRAHLFAVVMAVLAAIGASTLLWASLANRLVWLALAATLWMGDHRLPIERLRLPRHTGG